MYASTSQMHAAQLMTLVMVMTIGVCNLSTRQSLIACVYAVVIMSLVILTMSTLQPQVFMPTIELANWLLVLCDLPVLMLMGLQLGKLRTRLKMQRIQLKDAVAQLSELATRDELTGLNNRGHMNDLLAHYTRRFAHCNEVFSVALIDLDHFKRINDQYGHAVGDEVLRTFAQLATKTMRTIDVVARWGGEEFLVLCVQSQPEQALVGLERLRLAFVDLQVSCTVPDLRASFSAGLTTPRTGEPIEGTLARADQALYQAKHAGRNRICQP